MLKHKLLHSLACGSLRMGNLVQLDTWDRKGVQFKIAESQKCSKEHKRCSCLPSAAGQLIAHEVWRCPALPIRRPTAAATHAGLDT